MSPARQHWACDMLPAVCAGPPRSPGLRPHCVCYSSADPQQPLSPSPISGAAATGSGTPSTQDCANLPSSSRSGQPWVPAREAQNSLLQEHSNRPRQEGQVTFLQSLFMTPAPATLRNNRTVGFVGPFCRNCRLGREDRSFGQGHAHSQA